MILYLCELEIFITQGASSHLVFFLWNICSLLYSFGKKQEQNKKLQCVASQKSIKAHQQIVALHIIKCCNLLHFGFGLSTTVLKLMAILHHIFYTSQKQQTRKYIFMGLSPWFQKECLCIMYVFMSVMPVVKPKWNPIINGWLFIILAVRIPCAFFFIYLPFLILFLTNNALFYRFFFQGSISNTYM